MEKSVPAQNATKAVVFPVRLKLYFGSRWIEENCRPAREFRHVGIRLDIRDTNVGYGSFEPRPAKFDRSTGTGMTSGAADQPCGSFSQSVRFEDRGKFIDAYIDFGTKSPRARQHEAYAILTSVRVKSR